MSGRLTDNNENSRQVAGFLGGGGARPDRGEGGLPHPGVYPEVDVGQVGEGDDPCAEQPRPVYVVVHVGGVHPE